MQSTANFIEHIYCELFEQNTKIKKKEAGNGPFKNKIGSKGSQIKIYNIQSWWVRPKECINVDLLLEILHLSINKFAFLDDVSNSISLKAIKCYSIVGLWYLYTKKEQTMTKYFGTQVKKSLGLVQTCTICYIKHWKLQNFGQRALTVWGGISVWLTSWFGSTK